MVDYVRGAGLRGLSRLVLVTLALATLARAAPESQFAGVVDATGTSPRIEKVKADLARRIPDVVDRFWADMRREHTPIVEPVPGNPGRVLVTLVWRGESGTKSVQASGREMVLIPNTDIWYDTFSMPGDHRLSYWFKAQGDTASGVPPGPRPDPLNPNRFTPPVAQERPASAIKDASPYMSSSILVLPAAPGSPWADPRPGVAPGRVEERSYQSKVYGTTRRIWVYTPPGRTAAQPPPSGVLICLWGLDYLNEIPVPTILDNLLSERKIPPLAAIFVDNTGDRFQDFQSTQKFTESLSRELIPWARTNLNIPADPRQVIVAGYSAAGLESGYVAFRHPELIGNVLSQSGAFWRGFEGEGASDPEWLAHQYAAIPRRDTKFYIDVGGNETSAAGGVFKDANIRLRDVLLAKGYAAVYEEVPGGEHEFGHWRSTMGQGLIFLTTGWK